MTFEEMLSMVFQPGAAEAFAFGVGFTLSCLFFAFILFSALVIFVVFVKTFLLKKNKPVTQPQVPGSGAAE